MVTSHFLLSPITITHPAPLPTVTHPQEGRVSIEVLFMDPDVCLFRDNTAVTQMFADKD